MTTQKQIDDGGSVTADLICQRHVAENVIEEDKVRSVGGLSIRDYFAAAALQGLCAHYGITGITETYVQVSDCYDLADAMLAERKEGS